MPAAFAFEDARSSTFAFDSPSTPTNFAGSARKRSRPTLGPYNAHNSTTPSTQASNWTNVSAAASIARSADAASPAPLVDTRYIFADGMATPSAGEDMGDSYERPDQSAEALFRRRWSMANSVHDGTQGPSVAGEQPGPSKRRMNSPNATGENSPGWGRMVFSLVGGVAGKMWDFCTGAAFSGFHAGGGQGYDLKPGPNLQHQNFQAAESIWEDLDSRMSYSNSWERARIPGQFPEDFVTVEPNRHDVTPPRPSKRLHTETGSGWVMVSRDLDRPDSRASSPRLSARREPVMARPSTPSHIPRPSQTLRNSSTNSQRKSLIPVSRRNTNTGVSFTGSPNPRFSILPNSNNTPTVATITTSNNRPASFASPRASPRTRERQYTRESYGTAALAAPLNGSPLSPEVQKYAAKLRREEREADASMNRLGAQLAALIREGKEALQSRGDAYGDGGGDDEGFEDGRW